jgi:3-hydroxyacyl-CoA dehydrogenase / enoyl-CoA hydratase / 3-hydroxybutyryl-CoA epimerase
VDKALVDFGMPMGPFRLTDEVGLDVANHVAPTMHAAFGSRFQMPGDVLKPFLKDGRLGKKSGDMGGFYLYRKGHVLCVNAELAYGRHLQRKVFSPEEIVNRCVLTMVNEAARCLGEGIVESVSELDLALVLGTGFAPFRGGLMGYAHILGMREVVYRLEQMASEFGTRFEPCQEILDIMESKDPLYAPHQI